MLCFPRASVTGSTLFKVALCENHWGVGEGETIKSKISPCLSSELIEEQVKVVRLGQSNTLLLIELLLEHAAFIFREQAF